MSKGFKTMLIAIAVFQLGFTTYIAYEAKAIAQTANAKACAVAAMGLGADYEACLVSRL